MIPAHGTLSEMAAQIPPPDPVAATAARERQARLTKPAGALGRLEPLSEWIASVQGRCPPQPFERVRVLVIAADHGIAGAGVSAYPAEVTAQMVANFLAGGAAVNVLARRAGASVRVIDIAVNVDTTPEISQYKVRQGSGRIDVEDACSAEDAERAVTAGRQIADEEIDAGADLLITGDMGIGNTTAAAAVIAAMTGTEPVAAVGRGTGISDDAWMRKVAAIRDALRRARGLTHDPVALGACIGGADLLATMGLLLQAAARRTPVLLDGVVSGAAALLADGVAPGAALWWLAGHRSTEPAHALALARLGLDPLVSLDLRLGEGTGALVALPTLQAAAATCAEMATFDEAGVSDKPADG